MTMPAHQTFEEAATLPCAAVLAWAALAGCHQGDTVSADERCSQPRRPREHDPHVNGVALPVDGGYLAR
jgi:hypothetical protein